MIKGASAICLAFGALMSAQNGPLSNDDIVKMIRAGVSNYKIVADMQRTSVRFDVSPAGLEALHAAGAEGSLLTQMIVASKRERQSPGFGAAGANFPVKDAIGHTARFSAWIKTENVLDGYAGLWWRVDGPEKGKDLAFDNSDARFIGGVPTSENGVIRGATGTTSWSRYQIELPVPEGATNINFGILFTGTGTAWVDSLSVDLDGVPYLNPQKFDFDFESSALKGFGSGGEGYRSALDNTTAYTGHQSLKMQYTGESRSAASSAQSKTATAPLSNADIVEMTHAGVPVTTIVTDIQITPVKFDVTPAAIAALRASGVAEAVVNQMTGASERVKYASAFGAATGTFPVKEAAGHTVRFSGWIRTDNVSNGYAGLWWRVDGAEKGKVLAFDNSQGRVIDGVPASNNGIIRGATGTANWTRYEIELPVAQEATNINFGVLFTGTGTAWVDGLRVELDGVPYSNPQKFDFDFESNSAKGFYTGGEGYRVGVDDTVAYTGRQSLKMQFLGDGNGPASGK